MPAVSDSGTSHASAVVANALDVVSFNARVSARAPAGVRSFSDTVLPVGKPPRRQDRLHTVPRTQAPDRVALVVAAAAAMPGVHTVTWSTAFWPLESVTVNRSSRGAPTARPDTSVEAAVEAAMVAATPDTCDHLYVSARFSGSELAEPSTVTAAPAQDTRLRPASATGGWFTTTASEASARACR